MSGDDLPDGQWDDELSSWPEDRRRVLQRRIAFVTVCGALITLIILTIVFVGNDKTSKSRVSANGTTSSAPSTTGFAAALPVGVTATSFGTTTSSTDTTTTTTTNPRENTTTTAPKPPFQYANHPKNVTGQFAGNPPACQPMPNEVFIFNTPSPGTLTIERLSSGVTASGSIDPDGNFSITGTSGAQTERYVGHTTESTASGIFQHVENNAPCSGIIFNVTWNLP